MDKVRALSPIKRWLIFNAVGGMGIVVQMGALFVFTSCMELGYLVSTGLAVETAVLHNFVWHECWTWADRRQGRGWFLRHFVGFHLTNGALSLAGNLLMMRILVETVGMHYLAANALAITFCSILNFLAGDCIVFRDYRNSSRNGENEMRKRSSHSTILIYLFAAAFLTCGVRNLRAAELQPETLKAWSKAVETAERRMSAELGSGKGFLALDFQDINAAAKERKDVLSGGIPITKLLSNDGSGTKVPDGMIHHWRGSVFIPGVPLDFVLSRVENPRPEDAKQEDVLESRVLESHPGQLKLFLKLQRSKIVTVVYNTEHLVRYRRFGNAKASSSSIATKIAEIENFRESAEREKPEGRDHGYLWRMNSYWRYEEVKGGVIVECESMTLSRSIPSFLEYMIRPIINSVARESMRRTLESTRSRMITAFRNSKSEIRDSRFEPPISNLEFRVSNHFRSNAARVVVGSMSRNATSA